MYKRGSCLEPLFVSFSFSEERNDAHNIISNPVILSEAKNLIKNMSSPRRGRKYSTILLAYTLKKVKFFQIAKIFFTGFKIYRLVYKYERNYQ